MAWWFGIDEKDNNFRTIEDLAVSLEHVAENLRRGYKTGSKGVLEWHVHWVEREGDRK